MAEWWENPNKGSTAKAPAASGGADWWDKPKGDKPKAKAKEKSRPAMERVLFRMGSTVPLYDEAADAMAAGIDVGLGRGDFGENWKNRRKYRETVNAETARDAPMLGAFADTLAGMVGARGAIRTAPATAPITRQMQLTPTAPTKAGLLANLPRKGINAARNATLGATSAYGAGLAGEGSGEERLGDANSLIMPGALFGLAGPAMVEGGTKVASAAKRIATTPKLARSQAKAGRILASRIPEAKAAVPSANQLPFEAMGPNARSVARAVAATPGPGQTMGAEAMIARRGGATERVKSDIAEAFGATGDDYYPIKRTTEASRAALANPAYKTAESKPIGATEYDNLMRPLLETDEGQAAMAKAFSLAKSREARTGVRSGWPQNYQIDNQIKGVEVPKASVLADIAEGWDQQLNQYRDQFGRLQLKGNPAAQELLAMRNEYVKRLGELVPEEAAARKLWADDSAVLDSLEFGRKVPGSNMDPELIADRTFESTPEQVKAQQAGMARGLTEQLQGPNPRKLFRQAKQNPTAMQRLRAAFGPEGDPGSDQAFQKFVESLEREAGHEESFADLYSGSRTTPLREDIDATNMAAGGPEGPMGAVADVIGKKMQGQSFVRQGLRAAGTGITKQGAALNDPVVNELLGQVLFKGRDPNEVMAMAAQQQLISEDDFRRLRPLLTAAAGWQQGE